MGKNTFYAKLIIKVYCNSVMWLRTFVEPRVEYSQKPFKSESNKIFSGRDRVESWP